MCFMLPKSLVMTCSLVPRNDRVGDRKNTKRASPDTSIDVSTFLFSGEYDQHDQGACGQSRVYVSLSQKRKKVEE